VWYFQCLTSSPPFQTASRVAVVVPLEATGHTVAIVRAELLEVIACVHRATVVLHEEAVVTGTASVDAVPIRPEMATAASGGILPLHHRFVASQSGTLSGVSIETDKDIVSATGVGQGAEELPTGADGVVRSTSHEAEFAYCYCQRETQMSRDQFQATHRQFRQFLKSGLFADLIHAQMSYQAQLHQPMHTLSHRRNATAEDV